MLPSLYLALLATATGVVAQQSTVLFIPGFDEQPLSADVLGVGSDGRTTWALQAPTVTPPGTTFDDPQPGTATLVEGSDYVSVGQVLDAGTTTVTFAIACSVSGSAAICSDGIGGTEVVTESVSGFAVQLGTTLAAAPTPVPNQGASTTGASSGSGLTTVKSTQSSGSSSSTPPASPSSSSGASISWRVPVSTVLAAMFFVAMVTVA